MMEPSPDPQVYDEDELGEDTSESHEGGQTTVVI